MSRNLVVAGLARDPDVLRSDPKKTGSRVKPGMTGRVL